jgi:hypothetical protein
MISCSSARVWSARFRRRRKVVTRLAGQALELLDRELSRVQALPFAAQALGVRGQRLLQALAALHGGQRALGGLAGQLGDVVQAVARIRQVGGRVLEVAVVAQLAQRVMQRARQVPDAIEHVGRLARRHGDGEIAPRQPGRGTDATVGAGDGSGRFLALGRAARGHLIEQGLEIVDFGDGTHFRQPLSRGSCPVSLRAWPW